MLERDGLALLKLAETYGDGLDLSGPRIPFSTKAIARGLIAKGCLDGKLKSLRLTERGRVVLQPSN